MRYPPQFLDRLRQHFRLSEVIGRYLSLRKAGREFHALCPFHNEKTPSFTINDEKAFYHCFGCGAHGDVISFIKDKEGISWNQAVESLARDAGLELPRVTPQMREKMHQNETLYQILEKTSNWFSQRLSLAGGTEAREYLKRRSLSAETQAGFRLGYAPEAREGLKSHLLGLGFAPRDIEAAGVLSTNDSGVSYDKFRGRVMFPIRDVTGRVVGFGGRLLVKSEHAPKYLNSPHTALFDKGRMLYNADQARVHAARGKPLLVGEGYMDVIALHQAGFEAAVAPLGTAVTQEHLRLLWQLADEPVMCLDGDPAGLRAMQRVVTLAVPLLKPGKSLRFCLLPAGEDPDSLIASRGPSAMQEALTQALPLVEMLWRMEVEAHPVSTPEQRAAKEQRLLQAVESIEDMGVRRAYRDAMRQRFWEFGRQRKPSSQPEQPQGQVPALKAHMAGVMAETWRRDTCIRQMLSILLYFPQVLTKPEVEGHFNAMAPSSDALTVFYQRIMDAYMEGELSRSRFMERAQEAEKKAWHTAKPQFDLQQLLKQSETQGEVTAHRYYLRLASQLIEIQMEADLLALAAETEHDARACERLHALQQQLVRMKSQDALLLGDAGV